MLLVFLGTWGLCSAFKVDTVFIFLSPICGIKCSKNLIFGKIGSFLVFCEVPLLVVVFKVNTSASQTKGEKGVGQIEMSPMKEKTD